MNNKMSPFWFVTGGVCVGGGMQRVFDAWPQALALVILGAICIACAYVRVHVERE